MAAQLDNLYKYSRYTAQLHPQLEESKQKMAQLTYSWSDGIDWVMEQKRAGKIPGIFGRMGDLATIGKEYDTAVSNAFPLLDFILVDTISTATTCLEGLRANDRGQCGFFFLDHQTHFIEKYKKWKASPLNAPRLFDLITVIDERVLPAFYLVMRDTLFADNIEQARQIANGNPPRRVVTKEGEILELDFLVTSRPVRKVRSILGTWLREDTRDVNTPATQAIEKETMELAKRVSNIDIEEEEMEDHLVTHPIPTADTECMYEDQ